MKKIGIIVSSIVFTILTSETYSVEQQNPTCKWEAKIPTLAGRTFGTVLGVVEITDPNKLPLEVLEKSCHKEYYENQQTMGSKILRSILYHCRPVGGPFLQIKSDISLNDVLIDPNTIQNFPEIVWAQNQKDLIVNTIQDFYSVLSYCKGELKTAWNKISAINQEIQKILGYASNITNIKPIQTFIEDHQKDIDWDKCGLRLISNPKLDDQINLLLTKRIENNHVDIVIGCAHSIPNTSHPEVPESILPKQEMSLGCIDSIKHKKQLTIVQDLGGCVYGADLVGIDATQDNFWSIVLSWKQNNPETTMNIYDHTHYDIIKELKINVLIQKILGNTGKLYVQRSQGSDLSTQYDEKVLPTMNSK